jgi:uncharacterized protein YbjT (DUF2867 family)
MHGLPDDFHLDDREGAPRTSEGPAMLLITGATGTIGRPLVDILITQGVKVRAVTHGPQAANLPIGVEVVEGDLTRPEGFAPFLEGVTALFLHPRAVGLAAGDLLTPARQRGVQRVVALLVTNVDDPLDQQPSRYNGDRNKEVEDAAVGSGLEWVSLRASSFARNTLDAWGAQIRAGDVVRYPYASFAEALIHERDLAEAIARALRSDALVARRGRRLELTARSPSPTSSWSPSSARCWAGRCASRSSRRRRPPRGCSPRVSPGRSSRP